jgi:hypothetical protein
MFMHSASTHFNFRIFSSLWRVYVSFCCFLRLTFFTLFTVSPEGNGTLQNKKHVIEQDQKTLRSQITRIPPQYYEMQNEPLREGNKYTNTQKMNSQYSLLLSTTIIERKSERIPGTPLIQKNWNLNFELSRRRIVKPSKDKTREWWSDTGWRIKAFRRKRKEERKKKKYRTKTEKNYCILGT